MGQRKLLDFPEAEVNSEIAQRFEGLMSNVISLRTLTEESNTSEGIVEESEIDFQHKVAAELFNLKSLVSRVSTHLPEGFRDFIFGQFDRLYDLDDWIEGDSFISQGSCSTFLKLICDIQPGKFPSLGVSDNGDLMASWRNDCSKLIVYALGDDRVRWNLFVNDGSSIEQFAGHQNVKGFKSALAKHGFPF